MRLTTPLGAACAVTLALVLAPAATASPGDLDTTFATNGVAAGPLITAESDPFVVVGGGVRPDGSSFLVAGTPRSGDAIIAKYSPSGRRDTDFAPGGERRIDLPAGASASRVAIDESGVYVAGTLPDGGAFVARASLATGALVSTWGNGGVTTIVGGVTAVSGLALQSFGEPAGSRAVVLLTREGVEPPSHLMLARLRASGEDRDPTFGNGYGRQPAGVGDVGVDLVANALGIWALGTPSTGGSYTLARYLPDGAPATGFGVDGSVSGSFSPFATGVSIPGAIAVDEQDRVYVGGRFEPPREAPRTAVVRYTSAGARDTNFGSSALFTSDDAGEPSVVDLVADDRGVLAAGAEGVDGARSGRTLVLDPDGKQHLATLRTGPGDILHRFAARNADGRALVGGRTADGVFIARFGGPNQAPAVSLNGPAKARPGEPIILTATGVDPDGDSDGLLYSWDVDGVRGFERSTGTVNTLETSVMAAGSFTARVLVTDASGKFSAPAEHAMTIAGNAFPVARFDVNPAAPVAEKPVMFDAVASSDEDGTVVSFAWDFDGDGSTDATGATAQFTYPQKGTYQVTLTVTDDTGAAGSEVSGVAVAGACGVFSGTAEAELMIATKGNDTLCGLGGDDVLIGLRGLDTISAGPGDDRVMGDRDCPVTSVNGPRVEHNESAFCTSSGKGQADRLFGGTGADVMDGDRGNDRISGQEGDDRVRGRGENDRVSGGPGNDIVSGQSGNDFLTGGENGDRLLGGPGRDILVGGSGKDEMKGGSGGDTLRARDGVRDRIRCGKGKDSVVADGVDKIHSDCERVRRARPSSPEGPLAQAGAIR